MAETSPWIAIVDDDAAVLRGLRRLLRSRAFRVKTYGSGQQHLLVNGIAIPTILITAHGDAAIDSPPAGDTFVARLRKPLHDEALFSAIVP